MSTPYHEKSNFAKCNSPCRLLGYDWSAASWGPTPFYMGPPAPGCWPKQLWRQVLSSLLLTGTPRWHNGGVSSVLLLVSRPVGNLSETCLNLFDQSLSTWHLGVTRKLLDTRVLMPIAEQGSSQQHIFKRVSLFIGFTGPNVWTYSF